jgi:iron complex outermembrane receptor protein
MIVSIDPRIARLRDLTVLSKITATWLAHAQADCITNAVRGSLRIRCAAMLHCSGGDRRERGNSMRVDIRRFISGMLLGGAMVWSAAMATARESQEERAIFLMGDGLEFQYDSIRLANFQPTQPIDPGPTQPLDPGGQPLDPTGLPSDTPQFNTLDAINRVIANVPGPAEAETGEGLRISAPSDLGQMLQDSENIQTVGTQRRSQSTFDPRIRGYHYQQIYTQAEGEYYLPARLDLDSMLNKIDPSLVESVTVIPGPYGLTRGPGFAFIDVDLIDTPRYCDCPQMHGRIGLDGKSNGGQHAERIMVMGGGSDYGFLMHYGNRMGSDYRAGNGLQIPSSYQSQNVVMQFGFDVSPYTKIEMRYNHFNMGPTEYYLQFFDIRNLRTNSGNVIMTTEDPCNGSVWVNQFWSNATDFQGDNAGAGKTDVRNRILGALGAETGVDFSGQTFFADVAGDVGSHGVRSMKTYGDSTAEQIKIGADFRYIAQSTEERFDIEDVPGDVLTDDQQMFATGMPRSVMSDPGIFTEISLPWSSYFRTTGGLRVDWSSTHRAAGYVPRNAGVTGDTGNERNDLLGAGYLAADLDLTCEWSARLSAGYAERSPNLVDRYGDGVFISMMQNGFNRVIGQSTVDKERACQVDASLRGDYDYCRIRASAFYSWIYDYNTYFSIGLDDNPPTGAALLFATNTPLATLQGWELYGDYDLNEQWSVFGTLQYVQGDDVTIGLPLPGIYPMESRLGLRVTDECGGEFWGLEWGWRLVDAQNRAGFLRDADQDVIIGGAVRVESPTPGFATSYLKGYYNYTENLHFIAGIDNLFDRDYYEHLDLRLGPSANGPNPPGDQFGPLFTFAPGFNAYGGVEYTW